MRALVTGATGFVGANLVAGLNAQGIDVRILRRKSSSLRALEGLDYESLEGEVLDSPSTLAQVMAGCEWVFHVAAISDYWRQDVIRLYEANVTGTKQMLAAAQAAGVKRFVFTSSLAALGVPADGKLLDESHDFNLRPQEFPYGHSKHLAEKAVRRAASEGLEAVIVNPSIVLGPRDVNQISGSLIVEAARGRLRFYPPGGANYVDIADVVAGHIAAAERGRTGERYILAGHNLPYREALTIICEVVGRPRPWIPLPRAVMPIGALGIRAARWFLGARIPLDENQFILSGKKLYADNAKAVNELGFSAQSFRKTVQDTYDWYNRHGLLT